MEIIKENLYDGNVQERDTACCLREDQAGCVQTQKSECKGAEGHNPPRTETLARQAPGHHKWVSSASAPLQRSAGWCWVVLGGDSDSP